MLVSHHPGTMFILVVLGTTFLSIASANNLALNKPSESSLIYNDAVPSRGNDGDTNNVFSHGSCVLALGSGEFPNAWWQVNLEAEFYIHSIAITNRGDAFEWRLHNFTVEVYPMDPANPDAVRQVCAVFPGTVGSGATEELECAPGVRGQFVRIQKNFMLHDDGLQFCEAKVYGKPALRAVFLRHPGQRLPGIPLNQESGTAAECGKMCFHMPQCKGFNFDGGSGGGTGTCLFMYQQESLVNDVSYDFFEST